MYVHQLLKQIGISETVIQNFANAGINTPRDLISLNAGEYQALGLTNSEEQKKLIFLTATIMKRKQMAAKSSSPKGTSVTEVGITNSSVYRRDEEEEEMKTDVNPTGVGNPSLEPRRSRRIAAKRSSDDDTAATDRLSDNSSAESKPVFSSLTRIKSQRKSSSATEAKQQKITKSELSSNQPGRNSSEINTQVVVPAKGDALTSDQTDGNDGPSSSARSRPSTVATGQTEVSSRTNSLPKQQKRRTTLMTTTRPRSNLPMSIRTGKNLSSIPDSDQPAPQSPIVALPSSSSLSYNENEGANSMSDHVSIDKTKSLNSSTKSNGNTGKELMKQRKLKRQTLAGDEDSLDRLLKSTNSESSLSSIGTKSVASEGESLFGNTNDQNYSNDHSDGHGSQPRNSSSVRRSRAKSMYSGDPSLPTLGQSKQLHPPRSKRSSISTTTSRIVRPSSSQLTDDSSRSCHLAPSQDSKTGPPANDSVSGMSSLSPTVVSTSANSDPSSFALQIEDLREQNDEEHDMFCSTNDANGSNETDMYYLDHRIKVILRKRPMSKKECLKGGVDIVHPLNMGDFGKILLYKPKLRVDLTKEVETIPFAFDDVFDETSTNVQIYDRSVRHLIGPFFDGQFVTCFAYGATGSGKTFTMMGSQITGINAGTASDDKSNVGLYYLAAVDIFTMLELEEFRNYSVQISMFEIKGTKLYDLLASEKRKEIKCLEDRNGSMCFRGITEFKVTSPNQVLELIERGSEQRSTGETSANVDSSRSHAILNMKLVDSSNKRKIVERGRFSFIDLAGSERGADTYTASRSTRQEGADINTSLLSLKEVIRALATDASHIPFRGSELTKVLKDSFVGEKARCCMISCISPDIGNVDPTYNTLVYADRVKKRNPVTGALPSSCSEPTKKESLFPPRDEEVQESKSEESSSTEFSTDDLKYKVPAGPVPTVPPVVTDDDVLLRQKQEATKFLLAEHHQIMTEWLQLSRAETELSNNNEADYTNVDDLLDYVDEIGKIQDQQRAWATKLRQSLHDVRKLVLESSGKDSSPIGSSTDAFDEIDSDDDDSIEDLRD